jgi:membrane protein DedA with SNARE-associated domain
VQKQALSVVRKSQILHPTWDGVDLKVRVIRARSEDTKTQEGQDRSSDKRVVQDVQERYNSPRCSGGSRAAAPTHPAAIESESVMEFMFHWVTQYGYVGIFALLMLGIVGVPVPDETLLVFTGYLIFKQELQPVPAFLAAFLGSICGISVSYTLGRTLGFYLITRLGRYVHFEPEKIEHVRSWYEHKGKYALIISYFIPGIRHLAAYVAGSSKLPLPVFATFAYLGGLLWSGSFVTVGYMLGDEWARMSASIHRYVLIGAGVVIIAGAVTFLLVRRRHRSVAS